MHRRLAACIALIALSAAVAIPSTAAAARPRARVPTVKLVKAPTARQVLKNCSRSTTGLLTRPFSRRILRQARRKITGDISEYTGCFDAIRHAQRRAKSTLVVGIRKQRRGPFVAGQVVVRDARGRVVDARGTVAGRRTSFVVPRGSYTLRVGMVRGCASSVTVRPRSTLVTSIVCGSLATPRR